MKLLVFDIGGTFVKYSRWNNSLAGETNKFKTPQTYDELKEKMQNVLDTFEEKFDGIAISAPGVYNPKTREIGGISAVPYIHDFPIVDDLEKTFNLPVSIENDANCAGLCEKNIGVAQNYDNVACLVLGTGVGGSLFLNGSLYRGSANRGGEFGLTKNKTSNILSQSGTVVKVTDKYKVITDVTLSGEEIYKLYNEGDQLATELINNMYDDLALFIYNLQVTLDLELVVIGGGVSAQEGFADALKTRVQDLLEKEGVADFMVEIKSSQYKNDANLIGAATAFELEHQ